MKQTRQRLMLSQVTIFMGSFLSFFLQPMIGRTLLPIFGGSSTVWITCLVAFQILLLLGYGYAFLPASASRSRSTYAVLHLVLIAAAVCLILAVPSFGASLTPLFVSLPPALGVLIAVLAFAGLPALVLSANSTLVQSWTHGDRSVYHLYAISNVGSFVGLLVYPLLVEPFVALPVQWHFLGLAMAGYAVLLACCWNRGRHGVPILSESGQLVASRADCEASNVSWTNAALWVALPALTCALMTAATTYLTTDILAMPLVWTILLSAFLVSYVIGFSKIGERFLTVWMVLALVALAFAVWAMLPKDDTSFRFCVNTVAVLSLLVVVCSAFHSWLFALRPDPCRLPHFYFAIALGGCLGGILAGIVPPLVFETIYEYPIALAVSCAAIGLWAWHPRCAAHRLSPAWQRTVWLALALIVLVDFKDRGDRDSTAGTRIYRERGFYGVVSVENQVRSEYEPGKFCDLHIFRHGKTTHGVQLRARETLRKPTLYYSLNGGGIPFATLRKNEPKRPLRVAVVGMGMGTLAAYGRKGDYFRLYEISPEVINVATNPAFFSFLADCPSKIDVVPGDARMELQKDAANGLKKFDIFVVDVYSGDSVPGHLVTQEAFTLFGSLLKDDGILAFHISNWHIDLYSVMKAAAKHLNMNLVETLSGAVTNDYASETAWAFMTKGEFEPYMPTCCQRVDLDHVRDIPLMTDACGSLVFNIRFGYYPALLD